MKYLRKACAILALSAPPALAAPFCVENTGIPPQCLYVDPGQCQSEANRTNGRCVANGESFKVPQGQSAYCVVESGTAISCVYPDQATCRQESARRRGACVAAPSPPALHAAPDPFAIQRPY
jgi:hypothetical protein